MVFVGEKAAGSRKQNRRARPEKIVIAGGGAAGFAAAEMLRRLGHQGGIVMVSEDAAAPVDRPNLSKDYLAGAAPEEWVPLRQPDWYAENGIELRLGAKIGAIKPRDHEVALADGGTIAFRPAAAGHGRRAGAACHSGRRALGCPDFAEPGGLPRDHRPREQRAPSAW